MTLRPWFAPKPYTTISTAACLKSAMRPDSIEKREEFGHWEIDTVLGRRSNDHVLLTLTERKTRYHLLLPLASKTAEAVDEALKQLKSQYGLMFSRVFKSITADNGSEFANLNVHGIDIYYAHPYSAWERATNERHNGLVRRLIPREQLSVNCRFHKLSGRRIGVIPCPEKSLVTASQQSSFSGK